MHIARIFQPSLISLHAEFILDEDASHHVARVLRAKVGDKIRIFDGKGGEYAAIIKNINKKNVNVYVEKFLECNTESTLNLQLAQGISRGEKMDFTIQKAVELGVKKIIPLFTDRCNVKLDEDRAEKRLQHWRSIIISACEQSGRTHLPDIVPPMHLSEFLKHADANWKFVLAPDAQQNLGKFSIKKDASVILLIGPEGGLNEDEIKNALHHDFHALNLGPRILRTETAAIAAMTALQFYAGDL